MRQDKFEVLGVVAWFGSVGLCLSAFPALTLIQRTSGELGNSPIVYEV